MAKRKRRLNSADSAAAMYESFHGAPSTGELVIEDRVHYHGNLAELGVLCGLKVRVVTGYDVTLQFGGNPKASNPRGKRSKAGPGPLTKAYRFGTGIVPGLLEGADSALGKVVNPNALYDRIAAHFAFGGVVAVATYAKQTVYKSLDWFKPGKGDEVGVYVRRGKHWDYVLPQYIRYGTYKKNAKNPGSDTGPVILCSNEAGNQLYFRGGDQALDLASIKMADFERDHMVIGEVWAIAYATKKDFDGMTETEYVHVFSDERLHQRMPKRADLWEDALPPRDQAFGVGQLPTLMYDTLNKAMALAGGAYKIDKPLMSTSPGIEG